MRPDYAQQRLFPPALEAVDGTKVAGACSRHFEGRRVIPFLNDVDHPAVLLPRPRHKRACINAIRPNPADTRQPSAGDLAQHPARAVPILHIGGMHDDGPDQPKGVDQQMPFPSLDAFARVVPTWSPFCVIFTDWLSRINALGVQ